MIFFWLAGALLATFRTPLLWRNTNTDFAAPVGRIEAALHLSLAAVLAPQGWEGDGVTIRRSSIILLAFASANRDPRVFAEPDRFHIERKDGAHHLAFGLGKHACIGGSLVRMEFSAALRKLFDGSRPLRLANKKLTWAARPGHRWPVEVQLEIG